MSRIRLIESTRIYSGEISLRKDRFSLNGRLIEKEIVEYKQSVGIVPIIGDAVLLVSQYRHAAGKTLLEIPAGKIESGETPRRAAAREMSEEIGYGGKLKPLVKFYLAPGYDTEFMHVFIATGLKKTKRGIMDADEDITVTRCRLDRAMKKCIDGQICDSKTIAALLAYSRIMLRHHESEGSSALHALDFGRALDLFS